MWQERVPSRLTLPHKVNGLFVGSKGSFKQPLKVYFQNKIHT